MVIFRNRHDKFKSSMRLIALPFHANAHEKGMIPSLPLSRDGLIVGQTRTFGLGKTTSLGEGNTLNLKPRATPSHKNLLADKAAIKEK